MCLLSKSLIKYMTRCILQYNTGICRVNHINILPKSRVARNQFFLLVYTHFQTNY